MSSETEHLEKLQHLQWDFEALAMIKWDMVPKDNFKGIGFILGSSCLDIMGYSSQRLLSMYQIARSEGHSWE